MKIKNLLNIKKILLVPLLFFALAVISSSFNPVSVNAITCPDGSFLPDERASECPPASSTNTRSAGRDQGGPSDEEIETDCKLTDEQEAAGEVLDEGNCRIMAYLLNGINFLSAVVGIVAVFSLIWAGYQYMMARDNSQAVSAAKSRIITTIIALVLYMFMWAILQWLVPGGVL